MDIRQAPVRGSAAGSRRHAPSLAIGFACCTAVAAAGAATTYQANIQAPINQLVVNSGRQAVPLDIVRQGCVAGGCYDVALTNSPAGLSLQHGEVLQAGTQPGESRVLLTQSGHVTIVPTPDNAWPADAITAGLWLHSDVSRQLSATGDGLANIVSNWRVDLNGGQPADLWESVSTASGVVSSNSRMWRSEPDLLVAELTMRVNFGYVLNVALTSVGTVQGSAESSASSFASYLLSLPADQPVFTLPMGYTAWSDDWHIVDNHWCPNGCAPVPEPSSGVLLAAGLAVLPWFMRRLRRDAMLERT